MIRRAFFPLLAVAAMSLLVRPGLAEEAVYTEIAVEKMCCKGCAQKIASKLYTVRGVKEVRVNIPQKKVYVYPTQSASLSPKAVWEAVVAGKDNPLRLAGPQGTFTQKPHF
ncbi:MAG: heavy metal-associated domain-containing protein [Pirellulales bacterium]